MRENILSIQSVHSLNFNHIWVDSSASVIHFPINRINHLPSIGGDKHTHRVKTVQLNIIHHLYMNELFDC